jgi:CxxC motif-containing protein (DUF1111 family)
MIPTIVAMKMANRCHASVVSPSGEGANQRQAIVFHGGEAAKSRDEFERLNTTARVFLLRFLSSL